MYDPQFHASLLHGSQLHGGYLFAFVYRPEIRTMLLGPRGLKRKEGTVAIVCYADGSYAPLLSRLRASVRVHSPTIPVFTFSDPAEIGSLTHAENPYAFKVYAIDHVRKLGYRYVIWCDSVLQLQKPIEPLLPEITARGVYLAKDGWACGTWANDRALHAFGMTRDDAMNITSIWACFMAFDFAVPVAEEFLRQWKRACDAGLFHGLHSNDDKTESEDPRCRGHRHDQTCAELVAYMVGISPGPHVLSPNPGYPNRYFTGRELW